METRPNDEARRLGALYSFEILDTDAEPAFDRIAGTAARIFDAPIALVSLVDEDRQWFKACVGLQDQETSRDVSFCSRALVSDEVMVVPDATQDPRFAANPMVTGSPHIRFYAGAPLVTRDGYRLGTLCVIDTAPRPGLDPDERRILMEMAALVVDLLEMRRTTIETHRAEATLADQNRLLAALVDSSVDAILTKDPEGIVTSWNRAAEKLYGYSAEEVVGNPVSMLMPDELKGEEKKILARVLSGEPLEHYETRRMTKDGRRLSIALSVSPIRSSDGTIVGAATIQRDIGPLKEAQEALDAARETAEKANLAKSEFLSRMSHELRTPLNAILGFGQLLEMDDLTPDQAENVKEMVRGGRHLLELINEILDISRIETGRLALSVEPVPLRLVVQEVCSLVRPLASQRNINLSSSATVAEDVHVLADQQRLRQVLINLVSNALKYNRDGGSVTIDSSATGDRVFVSVSDTGPGIRPEHLEAIFTPFERIGAELSHVEGSGLGLAITRRLVEAMGGSVQAESVVGEGSTFRVELTVAPAAADTVVSLSTPLEDAPDEAVVLYVEDNVSNLRLVQRIVDSTGGMRLISCERGSEAVELALRERPNLVLLDLNLPDIPGPEVLHRLQLEPLTADIPIVVLSADATQGQIKRLLHLGARAYLTKPLDVAEFRKVVADLLAEQGTGAVIEEEIA